MAIKDEFGNVSICTMIMNVSSDRITEVLKFNGEDFVSSEEILELIKQNDELYIQGLSLYNAVMKSLEKGKAADVVPINFHNESIVAYQNKEPEEKLDHKVDADNSLPPSINSNASTQTKVKLQQIATQTEINSQQMDELILNNQMLSEENVELKQEIEAETNQAIVRLERRGSNLKDELEEEILKFDIEESENKYEEFPEDMMLTLELTKDNACNNDDIIEMLNGLKEEIRADGQRSLNDQFYILKEGVSNELDNESCVPLKEKTTLRRSLSFDGGYGSDKENCDDDLSSNISSISSVEKVAESRNVGKALL